VIVRKTVVLIGAFDTKAEDFAFVKARIEERGCKALLIDFGVLGEAVLVADIDRAAVAKAADHDVLELATAHDRGKAVTAMAEGATVYVLRLFREGRLHGIMAMGGGAGTTVGTAVMRKLPISIPKLMVSTIAPDDARPYVGTSDIIMMPSIVDVAGLNRISRLIYTRAADAICSMAKGAQPTGVDDKRRPLVAATMFGVTTPCVSEARRRLEGLGAEVLIFHANGGGRTMEGLIGDGLVDAVLDLTTTEWADELFGGTRPAGPYRLEAAAKQGIPQVVSVGALDMVNFGSPETIPKRFRNRLFHRHNAQTTLMRTTPDENGQLGKLIAGKLNAAKGPVVLMLPLRGVSALDSNGEAFDDPVAREALFAALKNEIDPTRIELDEVDAHINDPHFAELAADRLWALMAQPRTGLAKNGERP
jgi:uncharacterized protein (UPF0261 family)